MAIIKTSALVSEIRGKVGGVVFARNRGGAYVRQFVSPVQAETEPRTEARGRLGQISAAWETLTDTQRQGWTDYGQAVGSVNSLGDTHPISGIAAFVRSNSLLMLAGQSMRLLAPDYPLRGPIPYVEDVTLTDAGSLTLDLVLSSAVGLDDPYVIVQASPVVSPVRESPAGLPMRVVGTQQASDAEGPVEIDLPSVVSWVNLPDLAVFLRIRTVTPDGRPGDAQFRRVVSETI